MALPPGSKFRIRKGGVIAAQYQYQSVSVDGLGNSYSDCLKRIAAAIYTASSTAPTPPADTNPAIFDHGAAKVYQRDGALRVILDYRQLFLATDPSKEFDQLGAFLINAVAGKLPSVDATSIPATITQRFVKKVFDLIPFPAEAAAARYGYSDNSSNFMLMFDEDLYLEMDAEHGVDDGVHATYREKGGTYPFYFHLDKNGQVSQNPLAADHAVQAPDNLFQGTNVYLISSFADLQNSSELRSDPFVVIFSPAMKRNNGNAQAIPYANPDDNNLNIGNFMLFNLKQPGISGFNFSEQRYNQFNGYTRSVFGVRAQGKVVFDISVNNVPRKVMLGDRLSDVAGLPEKVKVYRRQNGKFYRVCGDLSELILLPGDQIKFSL